MKKLQLLILCMAMWMAGVKGQTFTSMDINTGAGSSYPDNIVDYNGKVYFRASDDANGSELWVSDGTPAGTHIVKDLRPGPGSSSPYSLTVMNNMLFFGASDSVHGVELWISDGTASGTVMVSDINPGIDASAPFCLTVMNNKLFFSASDGTNGTELWVSDGTSGGTSMVKDISPGANSSSPAGYVQSSHGLQHGFNLFNNKLYFRADDVVHGYELWVTDGSTLGTTMVVDIRPGPGSANPFGMTSFNGSMLFCVNDSIHGYELWTSDGTSGGTSLLKDIEPGIVASTPGNYSLFLQMGNKLYFEANTTAAGFELWQTDGSSAGTTMVKDILPGPGSSQAGIYSLFTSSGKLYFAASDSINGVQLWSSDGTSAGTTLVKVLSTTPGDNSTPMGFIEYNGQIVFTAYTGPSSGGEQLWTSDGTSSGTHIIAPAIAPNTDPVNSGGPLCLSNGQLFFAANYNSIGNELWAYHTTGVGITEASNHGNISAYPNPFSSALTLTGLETGAKYIMTVTNVAGQQCYSAKLDHVSETTAVSIPELSAGMYVVRVAGVSGQQTWKMVKE